MKEEREQKHIIVKGLTLGLKGDISTSEKEGVGEIPIFGGC